MARRNAAAWRELLIAQRQSGLSATDFCRQEQIDPKYFYLKRKQLVEPPSSRFTRLAIEPVTDTSTEREARGARLRVIELTLPGDTNDLENIRTVLGDILR